LKIFQIALTVVALAVYVSEASAVTMTKKLSTGIEIVASEEKFSGPDHVLEGCDEPFRTCLVDGVPAVGSIHRPKTVLVSVIVKIDDNKRIRLDTSGMFDPLLPADISQSFGGFCYDDKNCSFRAVLGDAGGAYVAEWVMTNGVLRRTILSDSADLVQFFKANLLPPRYN
jgi:hypothetical protein